MREGRATTDDEAAAAHGFAFLAQHLWDRDHGGFFWEADATGCPTGLGKQLYGHAFALVGVAEYALASSRSDAVALAHATVAVLEERFKDRLEAGYIEAFTRNWRPYPADRRDHMALPFGTKLTNSHLHLLNALCGYHALGGSPADRARIDELCRILTGPALRHRWPSLADSHRRDWTPDVHPIRERCSYGHDVEAAHRLIRARELMGALGPRDVEVCRGLVEHALRYGEDPQRGGLFAAGPPGGRPTTGAKDPGGCRRRYCRPAATCTGLRVTPLSPDAAVRTLRWILCWHIDWDRGCWHAEIDAPDDVTSGQKAGP